MTFIASPRRTRSARFPFRASLTRMFGIWRQRRTLKALDEDALRDIGVTRAEAEAEANRPIWDAPDTWRC